MFPVHIPTKHETIINLTGTTTGNVSRTLLACANEAIE
jgi:hypothetical protein